MCELKRVFSVLLLLLPFLIGAEDYLYLRFLEGDREVVHDIDIYSTYESETSVPVFSSEGDSKSSYKIPIDDSWPDTITFVFNVFNNQRRILSKITYRSTPYIDFQLHNHINLRLEEEGFEWDRKSDLESSYKVQIFQKHNTRRVPVTPNLYDWSVSGSAERDFIPLQRKRFSASINYTEPFFEIETDKLSHSWPEDLPRLNHFAVLVTSYSESGVRLGMSSLKTWPKVEPYIRSEVNEYNQKSAALGLSALLMYQNANNWDSLPVYPLTEKSYNNLKNNALSRDWGIDSREDLLRNIEWLKNDGQSAQIIKIRDAVKRHGDLPLIQIGGVEEFSLSMTRRLLKFPLIENLIEGRDLHAWDYGRGVNMARWGYTFGYLSEEEAWDYIDHFHMRIKEEYKSWNEFAYHYSLGRFFWSLQSGREKDKISASINSFNAVKKSENNVWNGPWDESGFGPEMTFDMTFSDLFVDNEADRLLVSAIKAKKNLDNTRESRDLFIEQLDPGWEEVPQICLIISEHYERFGPLEEAISLTQEFAGKFPDVPKFRKIEARLWEKTGSRGAALGAIEEIEPGTVNWEETLYLKGRLYYLEDKWDIAVPVFQESLESGNEKHWFYLGTRYLQALSLFKLNRFDTALDSFEYCFDQKPEDPYFQYYLGTCLLLSSDPDFERIESLLLQADSSTSIQVSDYIWSLLNKQRNSISM